MRKAAPGTLLIVTGIAVGIIAARHAPLANISPTTYLLHTAGWSATAYDIVRVAGWALLVLGIVTVAFALVRELRSHPPA